MTGIQVFLLSAFIFMALYFFVRLRNRIADVFLLALLVITAVLLILFPEWTAVIAHKLGVGRGADLVFYTCIVLFFFIILKLYSRLRKLEQITTELIRKDAKEHAERPGNKTST